ncbi:cysteine hydrolase family protein [Rubrivirga sp.]|uniref:cysteine hydrolase family protein n=1 Tax=Rubrivirga sp. TaxID=1885344 RepID=UPI003B52206C
MPDSAALLLVDLVNPFDFDGAEALLERAGPAFEAVADLARRARAAGAPVVYVNDNFTRWTESFDALVERCTADDAPGRAVVARVLPAEGDYHVLKPMHSGFYQTPLAHLLGELGVGRVVLAGVATDICVLATAMDARMRDLDLVVPRDACAAETDDAHDAALAYFRRVLHAETPLAADVAFGSEDGSDGE